MGWKEAEKRKKKTHIQKGEEVLVHPDGSVHNSNSQCLRVVSNNSSINHGLFIDNSMWHDNKHQRQEQQGQKQSESWNSVPEY